MVNYYFQFSMYLSFMGCNAASLKKGIINLVNGQMKEELIGIIEQIEGNYLITCIEWDKSYSPYCNMTITNKLRNITF